MPGTGSSGSSIRVSPTTKEKICLDHFLLLTKDDKIIVWGPFPGYLMGVRGGHKVLSYHKSALPQESVKQRARKNRVAFLHHSTQREMLLCMYAPF